MLTRFLIAWILYAAIVGLALGGSFVAAFLEIPHAKIHQQTSQAEQHATEQRPKENSDEALARYTLWLTGFTAILALATVGLGIATVGLYLTGEKQIEIARANTDALINSEKAHLFISIKSETVANVVGRSGAWDKSPDMWRHNASPSPGVGYAFKNHGRTAAILKSIGEQMIVADEFPDEWDIEPRDMPDQLVISPDEESSTLLCYDRDFTVGNAVEFQKDRTAIWFYGYVRFADAFGQETTWRWRYCWRKGYGGFRLVWYEEAPPKKHED